MRWFRSGFLLTVGAAMLGTLIAAPPASAGRASMVPEGLAERVGRSPGVQVRADGDWYPHSMAASPSGDRVYVGTNGYLTTYDSATGRIIRDLRVGGQANTDIAVTPDGARAYLSNWDGGVYVVDLNANTVLATIPVAAQMQAVAMAPDGRRVYTSSWGTNGIWTIDTATNAVTAPVRDFGFTWYSDLVVSPDGRLVYAAAGKVVAFGADGAFVRVIDLGDKVYPRQLALSPGGDRLYAVTGTVNTVAVVETIKGAVIATFKVSDPEDIAVTRDGSGIYTTSYSDSKVYQLDAATGAIVTERATGTNPRSVLLVEPRNAMWVGSTNNIATFITPLSSPQVSQPPIAPLAAKALATTKGMLVTWEGGINWLPGVVVTVSASPGGKRCNATFPVTTCFVKGLAPGKRITFTLQPRNASGVGPAATTSASTPKPHQKPKPAPRPAANPAPRPQYTPPPPVVKPPQSIS